MSQQEKEDQFILILIREIGPEANADGSSTADWTQEQLLDGFRSNHNEDLIRNAADGLPNAVIQLRLDCGLSPFI